MNPNPARGECFVHCTNRLDFSRDPERRLASLEERLDRGRRQTGRIQGALQVPQSHRARRLE